MKDSSPSGRGAAEERISIKLCTADDMELIRQIPFRDYDLVEMAVASGGMDVMKTLERSLRAAEESYLIFSSDFSPIGLFGVTRDIAKYGAVVWMVGADELFKERRLLVSLPPDYLKRWKEEYGYLYNFIWLENRKTQKWLEHLGFSLNKEVVYTYPGSTLPFYMFSMGE